MPRQPCGPRGSRVQARVTADALSAMINGSNVKSVLESIVHPSLSSGRKRAWNLDRAVQEAIETRERGWKRYVTRDDCLKIHEINRGLTELLRKSQYAAVDSRVRRAILQRLDRQEISIQRKVDEYYEALAN